MWKRLKNSYGINKHQEWQYTSPEGRTVSVHSNEDVLGNKWYTTNGEGTHTTWFKTKQIAVEYTLLERDIEAIKATGLKSSHSIILCRKINIIKRFHETGEAYKPKTEAEAVKQAGRF